MSPGGTSWLRAMPCVRAAAATAFMSFAASPAVMACRPCTNPRISCSTSARSSLVRTTATRPSSCLRVDPAMMNTYAIAASAMTSSAITAR